MRASSRGTAPLGALRLAPLGSRTSARTLARQFVLDLATVDNRAYYDQFAATYENERHHGYHAMIDRLEMSIVMPYVENARVLEAGCGTGMILKEVAPR